MDYTLKKITKAYPEVVDLDSDEEIFVGPVTEKEKEKAAKLSRRTQVFFPPVSWKLRSSNHSSRENESTTTQQNSSPMRNEANNLERVQTIFGGMGPSSPRYHDLKESSNFKTIDLDNSTESPSNGYTADISSVEKSNYQVTDADSLENGDSADSLNSLSRDSLDVDHDSLEETNKEGRDAVSDSSVVEDLYDAREYLNVREIDLSVPAAQKQFTSEEIDELQKQLDSFAVEIENERGSVEELHNSFETESSDSVPNVDSIFSNNQGLPSPYDLNKQRLSALLVNDSVDFSFRKSYPVDAKLDTVREVTEPSITDIGSTIRLSDDFSDSPRKGSTDNLPNSTQLFEELERQMEEEEEEARNSNHATVLSDCQPDATYTVESPRPTSNADAGCSLSTSYPESASGLNDSGTERKFNDTLEEIELLLKYGVDYIYGKHDKLAEEETKDERPASADSCGSERSGRSTPGTKAKAAKGATPAKKAPLTPSKAVPSGYRTPTKASSCAQSSCALSPARGPQRAATPRSASARPTKVNDPFVKKSLHPEKAGTETPKFKVPSKISVPSGRATRTQGAATPSPRPNKFLNQIQSPIGAYIHNSPCPVLMTNVKPKTGTCTTPRDPEKHHRPVWDNVGPRTHKVEGSENVNPNVGHGLRTVHYIQAPCVKLDDHSLPKSRLPRLGDRFEKLLDSPCPQVIKHEGRVRVNPASPQYKAAVNAVRTNMNDSTRSESAAEREILDESDEEVFVGILTREEKKRAAKLGRRTRFLFYLMSDSSDEEVFVGIVTEKEMKKASKLKRETKVFFPPLECDV